MSAYAINKDGAITDSGVFAAKPFTDSPHIRINKLREKLIELIETYEPDIVYLEDVFKQGSVVGFKSLAGCLYVCVSTCIQCNVPYKIIKASEWRKGVIKAKKRIDQKAEALVAVKELLNIDTDSDDVAEACLMSMYK